MNITTILKTLSIRTNQLISPYHYHDINSMRFYLEAERWYADIPTWLGPKSALEMVYGADRFLESIAANKNSIQIEFTLDEIDGFQKLVKTCDDPVEGAHYIYKTSESKYEHLWLCAVTEFVFGFLPNVIYYRTSDTQYAWPHYEINFSILYSMAMVIISNLLTVQGQPKPWMAFTNLQGRLSI